MLSQVRSKTFLAVSHGNNRQTSGVFWLLQNVILCHLYWYSSSVCASLLQFETNINVCEQLWEILWKPCFNAYIQKCPHCTQIKVCFRKSTQTSTKHFIIYVTELIPTFCSRNVEYVSILDADTELLLYSSCEANECFSLGGGELINCCILGALKP